MTPYPILYASKMVHGMVLAVIILLPGWGFTAKANEREAVSPKKLRVSSQAAEIPADGASTATIQGQFLDRQGKVAVYEGMVTLDSSAGEFIGTDADPKQSGFQVKVTQGRFQAKLQAGTEPQTVTIQAVSNGKEAYTQLDFKRHGRPGIATGVINLRFGSPGINFNESLRDFLPPDREDQDPFSIYGSAFATGQIGEWSFTGALNSDRALNEDGSGQSGLTPQTQPENQVYPVYGDQSETKYRVSSQDSVFLRLEQPTEGENTDPNFLMWGTYDTSQFSTAAQQFSATSRTLHGLKGNYTFFDDLQVTAFYSANLEGFQRDAIAPDGTSGLYFLSKRLLIPGSEEVYLETEPLNNSGTVVSRKPLTRGRDYTIDYDRGTLFFKNPIFRTTIGSDGDILVQRIIVNYQFESTQDDTYLMGSRARYFLSRENNQNRWLGASYIEEDQGRREFSLFGLDGQISVGDNGKLIAEYARSQMGQEDANEVVSEAYRVEMLGKLAPGISGRAFWQTTDPGFTNNATVSFVPGQTRYGAKFKAKVSDETRFRARYEQEENFGTAPVIASDRRQLLNMPSQTGDPVDNELTTISAGLAQQLGQSELTVDWIHRDREDERRDLNSNSDQLRSRLNIPLTDKLTAYGLNETTLSAETDAVLSDRTAVGLGWELAPGIELGASQQWFTRGQFSGQSITRINLGGNHSLGEDTKLIGRYSIAGGKADMTSQAALGFNHHWELLPGMKVKLGYERVFGGDFFGQTGTGRKFPQPFAVGQTVSSLGFREGETYHVSVKYGDNSDWKAKARVEHLSNPNGNNTTISSQLTGELSDAITALARYRQASASNQTLSELEETINLQVGFAYRDPDQDQWNALFKYEYRQNPATLPRNLLEGSGSGSTGHILSAEAIYAPSWQWEFYGKYALRDSTTFLAEDLETEAQVSLIQFRTTHQFAQRWDLTAEARWIEQSTASFNETGASLEVGYYLTPNLRVSAGYSLGEVDDPELGRTAEGTFVNVTYKLNQLWNGWGE